jgi:hypothetical protein
MSRPLPGSATKRRGPLAGKVALLDRLEPRERVTGPTSFTGMSHSALRGCVQIGIMDAGGEIVGR